MIVNLLSKGYCRRYLYSLFYKTHKQQPAEPRRENSDGQLLMEEYMWPLLTPGMLLNILTTYGEVPGYHELSALMLAYQDDRLPGGQLTERQDSP
ncbi:hypothetical protein [Entomobacter blattae]|uniref:Uncharacterized protein n=1 Tax=Entomobacter blattae TaxID=2762277 RepID=A0A7H1NTY0_9PROT|nr:hypothetical protein [Entomobacter blattae]QNT79240.1 hypothetical protein JGUZn3_20350 [Entomobacter blattae]